MSRRLALVPAIGLLVACNASPTVSGEPASGTPTPDGSALPADLAAIVVSPRSSPFGLEANVTIDGASALTRVVISERAAEFNGLGGFSAGRYTEFGGGANALLSLGVAFDTVQHADAAFDLFVEELGSDEGYGLGSGDPVTLGDEGVCYEGNSPALVGRSGSTCLWRHGRLVLLAGGSFDASAIHNVSVEMDERVTPDWSQETESRPSEPAAGCTFAPAALGAAIATRLTATPDQGTPIPGGVSLTEAYIFESGDSMADFYAVERGEFERMYFVGAQILGEGMMNIGAVWVTDDPSGGGSIFAVSSRARQFSDWPDRPGLEPDADGFPEADACAHAYNGER